MDSKLKEQFRNFLLKKPLYSKWKLDNSGAYLIGYNEFEDVTFTSSCKECSLQTFILSRDPLMKIGSPVYTVKGFYQEYIAKCQGCGEYELRFSFRLVKTNEEAFIQKIGQYPSWNKEVDKDIEKFLDEKNLGFYQKALMNLSTGYGIGAFTYLRRVIENELDKLIDMISQLETSDSSEVRALIAKHTGKNKPKLIKQIFQYLPASLKSLGDNPIQLLYDQTSIGIHALSDDECADRSISIDEILKKVVKELNREKMETQKVKEAINNLKTQEELPPQ